MSLTGAGLLKFSKLPDDFDHTLKFRWIECRRDLHHLLRVGDRVQLQRVGVRVKGVRITQQFT